MFEVFCELVKHENSDLFHLLNSSEGKAVVTYQILNRPEVFFCLEFKEFEEIINWYEYHNRAYTLN